jgi:hypothetical protein
MPFFEVGFDVILEVIVFVKFLVKVINEVIVVEGGSVFFVFF